MFTIQSIMLVSLGFLMALMMGFVVAPAYWGRAVRLTTERIRRSLPVTDAEIRADKDRLRAQHAIQVHQLQTRVETARLAAARQKVEINRREAAISDLEREQQQLNTKIEAGENARRVLEQTIMDRVPRVEERLAEARRLLVQRDHEMATLHADTSKTFRALDEAMQINAQQRAEIDRLKSAVATRGARSGKAAADPAFDGEVALRSELEALRTRTRDQASLIANLQEVVAANSATMAQGTAANGQGREALSAEVAQLDSGLEHAQEIVRSLGDSDDDAAIETAQAMRDLREQNAQQATEIAKLRAALQVFEEPPDDGKSLGLRDNKLALKAKVASLEKETTGQRETIQRLRSELAAANDRSARQAAHHMNELRRLGAGTVPASTGMSMHDIATERSNGRRSLADRITETVPATSSELARSEPPTSARGSAEVSAASEAGPPAEPAVEQTVPDTPPDLPRDAATGDPAGDPPPPAEEPDEPDGEATNDRKKAGARRRGLMQRIAGLGKN